MSDRKLVYCFNENDGVVDEEENNWTTSLADSLVRRRTENCELAVFNST